MQRGCVILYKILPKVTAQLEDKEVKFKNINFSLMYLNKKTQKIHICSKQNTELKSCEIIDG